MKKNTWLSYKRSGTIMEIRIRDEGGTMERFRFDPSNQKQFTRALQTIEQKYGWKPEVPADKSINVENKEEEWWG